MKTLKTRRHVARWAAIVLIVLFGAEAVVLTIKWPFVQRRVLPSLERATNCTVHFGNFRMEYLPTPGYVADNVRFERMLNGHPVQVAVLKKMVCRGDWASVISLSDRVHVFLLQGLQVYISHPFPPAVQFPHKAKLHLMTEQLIADGMELQVAAATPESHPFQVRFPRLRLRDLKADEPLQVDSTVTSSLFRGAWLQLDGRAGPVRPHDVAATPVSGSYRIQKFDPSQYTQLDGTLASSGTFNGTLQDCRLKGELEATNFKIRSHPHAVNVRANFGAHADMLDGNTAVDSLIVHFQQTTLVTNGSIEGQGKQKTLNFQVRANQARVEDLLYFFASGNPPSMRGPIRLQANTSLPPGREPFLRRVQLLGVFQIPDGVFSNASLQRRIDEFSARTRGRSASADAPLTPSWLDGRVDLNDGTAHLSDAKFSMPGATAIGGGTFSLVNKDVNITGKLATQGSLSRDAGGWKSVALAPLDPFFRKKNAGAVLPVSITGRYPNARFRVSLRKHSQK